MVCYQQGSRDTLCSPTGLSAQRVNDWITCSRIDHRQSPPSSSSAIPPLPPTPVVHVHIIFWKPRFYGQSMPIWITRSHHISTITRSIRPLSQSHLQQQYFGHPSIHHRQSGYCRFGHRHTNTGEVGGHDILISIQIGSDTIVAIRGGLCPLKFYDNSCELL